jgi:predicted transcriptional regulator
MPETRPDRLLTEAELDHMRVLWALGEANVRGVLEALPDDPPRAYTTVATVLRILDDKGFARSEKQGRTLVYRPALSQADYQARTLRRMLADVFDGDAGALVRQLAQQDASGDAAVDEMRSLLDELDD